MLRPDYHHCIINLLSSLAGEDAPAPELYPPLLALQDTELAQRPVALMIIDGMGFNFLQQFPDSCLFQHLHCRLTSVFPTTTATAVTGLALGVPAQQHGITGWYTYFQELGMVAMPLPFMPRGGGQTFDRQGIHARDLLAAKPLLPQLDRPVSFASPWYISDSPYSRGLFGVVRQRPHQDLDDFFDQVAEGLSCADNALVWGYWTELDALAHEYGIDSLEVHEHFLEIDAGFRRLLKRLHGQNALLLVTADHGFINTTPEQRLQLEDHPQLAECLRLPLCGEPRVAFCYLKPGFEAQFDRYVREQLGHCLEVYPSQQLLEQHFFGLGEPAPVLAQRIGDRVLLPKGNWVIKDRLLSEKPFSQIGVHGGLSEDELYVPLIQAQS